MAQLLEQYREDVSIVAWIAGLAHGIRLGCRFSPPPQARTKWISEEYKRLSEPNRRDVQRFIRKLLKAQTPAPVRRPPAASAAAELAAAREWTRTASARVRQEPRR